MDNGNSDNNISSSTTVTPATNESSNPSAADKDNVEKKTGDNTTSDNKTVDNKSANNSANNSAKKETASQASIKTDVSSQDDSKKFDIVLYGATSFVGQLTAAYLQKFLDDQNNPSASDPVTWAIAGRNEDKLNQVKKEIGNSDLPIIIANSEDPQSLQDMTAKTKVIITTVGPYLKYGEPLVKACTDNGTDYVDLCGEAIFVKEMMDKYQEAAKSSGARIVNACGFDSLPSDLGVLFTQQCAHDAFDEYCDTINMRVKALKGGLSGGTIASMGNIFESIAQDKSRLKALSNPYILNDDPNRPNLRQTNNNKPKWDAKHEKWVAPFIMESINTRIVHRSNQLRDYEYGRDFKYDEAMWMPSGLKGRAMSYGMTAAIAGFAAGMSFKPSRELLNNHVLPQSGEGPSKSERENGYFDVRFFGFTNKNHQIKTKVTGDKDPGYDSTCKMLAQSALCLLQDIPKDEVVGGFWTSASAMGDHLIERLEDYAGIQFSKL